MTMSFHQIDPIQDARWSEFVASHPKASVFHTVAWLQALRRTYGYSPVAFTTSPATSALKNGLLFCRINSWLTGSRLVSLPFSDHCDPLCDESGDLQFLIRYLQTALGHQGWKYLEFRPVHADFGEAMERAELRRVNRNYLHTINLQRDIEELVPDLADTSLEVLSGSRLIEKCGNSEQFLGGFYNLFMASHSQYGVPCNPYVWFQNLRNFHGDAFVVRLAYLDATPVAALLTLRYKETVYCNNGCSHAHFGEAKALPWLLWRTIIDAKSAGASEIEFGEAEREVESLLTFANPWVLEKKRLVYWKYPDGSSSDSGANWKMKMAKKIYAHLPNKLQTVTAGMLYKHIG